MCQGRYHRTDGFSERPKVSFHAHFPPHWTVASWEERSGQRMLTVGTSTIWRALEGRTFRA